MKTVYTYYKNSNTGELIMKQEFTESRINFPKNFYNYSGKSIEEQNLIGFVEVSEKKFNRECKKQNH